MDEDKVTREWHKLDNEDIEKVCEILKSHEHSITDYIADFVAAICNVEKKDMMTNVKKMHVIHSRWLFWYAYRYMTGEPFIRMSLLTEEYGVRFTEQSISNSTNKMGTLIASDSIWAQRWRFLKRIIKLRSNSEKDIDNTVVVQIPRELKDIIKIRITEK